MSDGSPLLSGLTEDELDTFVSIAIRRAEILDEQMSPQAGDAWSEVMTYEARLAEITRPEDLPGGVARVGAVTAALAAGRRSEASRLAGLYLAEASLPAERREAIRRAFQEDQERLGPRFPALSKSGRLAELPGWRAQAARAPRVFPFASAA
jgi:hypothetical protein